MARMINIGCGSTYHKDWINIDKYSRSEIVIAYDITRGLPFETGSVDVCYSSHILEHLSKDDADSFIGEQKRVLKKNGILRIVVPDLEAVCRNYIHYLNEMVAGNTEHEFRYDYTLIELFDQLVRDETGGEMGRLWASSDIEDLDFVVSRNGKTVLDAIRIQKNKSEASSGAGKKLQELFTKKGASGLLSKSKDIAASSLIRVFGKRYHKALRVGLFRISAEIHRVMYDRYSLERLLVSHGFSNVKACLPQESRIPEFYKYNLDVIEEEIRKPDSLFMEATL